MEDMIMTVRMALLFLCIILVSQLGLVHADERADYIRANYTKHERQIPMRDGVKLFTAI